MKEYLLGLYCLSNQRSCYNERPCLAISASNPIQSEVGPDLSWDFNNSIDKLCEIDVQTKPSDVEADAIIGKSNCKPVDSNKDCWFSIWLLFQIEKNVNSSYQKIPEKHTIFLSFGVLTRSR